jgi:predicted ATP-grasp superfamily ATP-dependent carboligase
VATRLLIAGVSTRAAAESAAKAGFVVTAIDAFGDLDQHPSVRSLSLDRGPARFTARAAARAVRDIPAEAAAYLSPFENHPRAVDALAAGPSTSLRAGPSPSLREGRALWGNPPDVLRRVRDPFLLAGVLRRQGLQTPLTRVDVPSEPPSAPMGASAEWLLKPFRSGGGHGIRPWRPGTRVPRGYYAQERVSGVPASIVFVAAGRRAVPLGISHQLVGDTALGASGYRYCGSVLASADDEVLSDRVVESATALAARVTEVFGLVGLNGIDCVVSDEVPYLIEVNPRWCSSMELVERHYGVSMFAVHAAACVDGVLPAFDLVRARQGRTALGKAIVFAREEVVTGDTRSWLADATVRDVAKPGERIAAGQPICTVFAEDVGKEECRAQLHARAQLIFQGLPQRGSRSAS